MRYAIFLALTIVFFQNVEAMSMFGVGKTCVFSSVKARLIRDGEPLKNTRVIRRWEWNELKEDSTDTDAAGYFELPAVFEESLTRMLPIELVIAQGLYVVENGAETQIWSNSKREPGENAELEGRPMELVCEMTNETKIHRDFGSLLSTRCTWERQYTANTYTHLFD